MSRIDGKADTQYTHIYINGAEQRKDPVKDSVYTVYIIGVETKIFSWTISKRYNELSMLDATLRRKFKSSQLKEFPEKRTFNVLNPQLVETRRLILQTYLQHIISVDELRNTPEFQSFIGKPNEKAVKKLAPSPTQSQGGGGHTEVNSEIGRWSYVPQPASSPNSSMSSSGNLPLKETTHDTNEERHKVEKSNSFPHLRPRLPSNASDQTSSAHPTTATATAPTPLVEEGEMPAYYAYMKAEPKNVADGFARGIMNLTTGIVDGLTGIVREPIAGAVNEGGTGLLKGVGMGVAGFLFHFRSIFSFLFCWRVVSLK
eukprot:TRINITY_DN3396_c0_g1_i2.p1 TRINITY_DN3396_c0_g1~~TRINITY_DN3396_c0_g1_i2.p1  ORF type:complete len:315 (-),score=63.11 TRINITY_DN3396_c0_g1_i2:755-1699(-)